MARCAQMETWEQRRAYNPNSQGLWDNQPEYADLPLALEGDADHYDHRLVDDHWEQPGNLFRKMTPEQKQLLFDNTARAINGASQEVLERHVANCSKADPAYGEGVAKAIAALHQHEESQAVYAEAPR